MKQATGVASDRCFVEDSAWRDPTGCLPGFRQGWWQRLHSWLLAVFFTLLGGTGLMGCGQDQQGPQGGGAGLAWSLAHGTTVEMHCAPNSLREEPTFLRSLQAARERIAAKGALEIGLEGTSASAARVLIGLQGDPKIEAYLDRLGVDRRPTKWVFGRVGVPLENAWLIATFRDPERGGLPLTVLCAHDERALEVGLTRLEVGTWPSARLFSGGFPLVQIQLTSGGNPIPKTLMDCRPWHLLPEAKALGRSREFGRFQVLEINTCDTEKVNAYIAAIEGTWQRLEAWAGPLAPKSPRLFAQDSAYHWRRGEALHDWAQVDLLNDGIRVLLMPGGLGDGGAAAGRAYLKRLLGEPRSPWLARACAVQAAGVYWGQDLSDWWSVLAGVQDLAAPSDWVVPGDWQSLSPHLTIPLQALLVQLVWEDDPSRLLWLWENASEPADWQPWLGRLGARLGQLAVADTRSSTLPTSEDGGSGIRVPEREKPMGIGLVMAGGLDPDAEGLASIRHLRAQDWARSIGIDHLAFETHLVSEPNGPLVRALPWSSAKPLADVRGEALLSLALLQAKERGLSTALVMDVWAKPSGLPLNSLVLPNVERVHRFFGDYQRAAMHSALQARLNGVSILSLGNGMGESIRTEARTQDDENPVRKAIFEVRKTGWTQVLQPVHQLFPGRVIMGADHSKGGFSASVVWGQLDGVAYRIEPTAQVMGQSGSISNAGIRNQWQTRLGNAHESAGDRAYWLWPISLKVGYQRVGAGDVGVPSYAGKLEDIWALLGETLADREGRSPTGVFLGPVDLAGQAVAPGESVGKLGKNSIETVLRGIAK